MSRVFELSCCIDFEKKKITVVLCNISWLWELKSSEHTDLCVCVCTQVYKSVCLKILVCLSADEWRDQRPTLGVIRQELFLFCFDWRQHPSVAWSSLSQLTWLTSKTRDGLVIASLGLGLLPWVTTPVFYIGRGNRSQVLGLQWQAPT